MRATGEAVDHDGHAVVYFNQPHQVPIPGTTKVAHLARQSTCPDGLRGPAYNTNYKRPPPPPDFQTEKDACGPHRSFLRQQSSRISLHINPIWRKIKPLDSSENNGVDPNPDDSGGISANVRYDPANQHNNPGLAVKDRLPSVSKSPSKVNSVRDGTTLNGPKSTISKDVIPAAGKQNDGEKPRASSQTFLSKQGSRIALYTDPLWKKISGNDGQPSSEETQPKCSKAVFASYTPAISNDDEDDDDSVESEGENYEDHQLIPSGDSRKTGLAEFRARLEGCKSGWILLLSIPKLFMLAHIQQLSGVFGGGGGRSSGGLGRRRGRGGRQHNDSGIPPSIKTNEYMDNMLVQITTSMNERGLDRLDLPDQENVISLYEGHVTGLTNLSRCGDACLEAATDNFTLTFALQAKDITAIYGWKKRRLKGEVNAAIRRVVINMAIKQVIPNKNNPPQLMAFSISSMEGVVVNMRGLGTPGNWLVKKILLSVLQSSALKNYVEQQSRDVIQQELNNITSVEEPLAKFIPTLFPI